MEITDVSQYNREGAKSLAKYGDDKNGNSEVDLNEANGNLSVDKFREVAAAGGDNPNTISYLDVLIYEGNQISQKVLLQIRSDVIIPEMIDIPGMHDKSIMKDEVTVKLFKQVMEGYAITGNNADALKAILCDPSQEDNSLTYVSLFDAREFAKRLSNLTGRKFRVQTEKEWLKVKDQLSGNNWTWTETKIEGGNLFVLRRGDDGARGSGPGYRYNNHAIRLVEVK
jgi:hypothetical protein